MSCALIHHLIDLSCTLAARLKTVGHSDVTEIAIETLSSDITFASLPEWLRHVLVQIRPNDYETAIYRPVPALGYRSIAEVFASGESGLAELKEYAEQVESRFLR